MATKRNKRDEAIETTKELPLATHPASDIGDGVGISGHDSKLRRDRTDAINTIVRQYRLRKAAQRACVRLSNQRLATIRSALGFETSHNEDLRNWAKEAARRVQKALFAPINERQKRWRKEKRKDPSKTPPAFDECVMLARTAILAMDDPVERSAAHMALEVVVASFIAELTLVDNVVTPAEKEIKAAMRSLPEWETLEGIHGVSHINVGSIIGEIGDIANMRTARGLRRMLGVAPFKGKALSTWKMKGGLSAAEWVEAGANPNRYVLAYQLAEGQVKGRGPYRVYYDERREYEGNREGVPPHVANKRAKRWMVTRLLNDLWAVFHGEEPRHLTELRAA